MRKLEVCNPIAVFVYILCTAGIAMFTMIPGILALSLAGALTYRLLCVGMSQWKIDLLLLGVGALAAVLNPLFNHDGVTVLFVLNRNPVTLEAVRYGVFAGVMLLAVMDWSRTFSRLMTSDRLLYLFGAVSRKLALILSMSLRYIPLFARQTRRVAAVQQTTGLYGDSVSDRIRGGARVFSVMVSWALENGIVTADSMEARGYGAGRRTRFALFRFRAGDGVLAALTLLLAGTVILAGAVGSLNCLYYPAYRPPVLSPLCLCAHLAYGLLAFLPAGLEVAERIRFR